MSPGKICLRSQQLTTTGTVSMAARYYIAAHNYSKGTVSMAAHYYRYDSMAAYNCRYSFHSF